MRVLVIGGGIGGTTAGIALREAGIDVEVFDRSESLTQIGAGATLWNNAIRALRYVGLAERVQTLGSPLQRFEQITPKGRKIMTWPLAELVDEVGTPSVGVTRKSIYGVLTEAYGVDAMHLGKECTGFRDEGDSVVAVFADGSEERGDLLIGADGITSRIRKGIPGQPEPEYLGLSARRTVVDVSGLDIPEGLMRAHWGPGEHFAFYPVGGGLMHWEGHTMEPEGGRGATKAELLERFGHYFDPVPRLIDQVEDAAISRSDLYARPPVETWGVGRVTLMGDAAHPMAPYGGQGACQAIEDAIVLADTLKHADDPQAGLRQFEAKRIPRTTALAKTTRMLAFATRISNPALAALRNRFLSFGEKPGFNTHRKRMAFEL
jgi:2-polyprenyl-6-methoxyphenol hydroxylase-like FAD-dependent oxidoreductase